MFVGKYWTAGGDLLEGEYRDGVQNGQGKTIFTIGNRYEGDYKDGNFHGNGNKSPSAPSPPNPPFPRIQ